MIHSNEVVITKDNLSLLMEEAEKLGTNHIAALKEQMERQGVKHATST